MLMRLMGGNQSQDQRINSLYQDKVVVILIQTGGISSESEEYAPFFLCPVCSEYGEIPILSGVYLFGYPSMSSDVPP